MKAIPKCCPSNLTPAQWNLIAPYLPAAKTGGRPRSVSLQAILNAIFYVLCSGCSWRMLQGDFPAWQTVYTYFRAWQLYGTWERIHRYLRQWIRLQQARPGSPSVAIMGPRQDRCKIMQDEPERSIPQEFENFGLLPPL